MTTKTKNEYDKNKLISYFVNNFFVSLLFITLTILLITNIIIDNDIEYFLIIIILIPTIIFILLTLRFLNIFKKLKKTKNNNIDLEVINCEKVKFLSFQKSRSYYIIACIVIYYRHDNKLIKNYYIPIKEIEMKLRNKIRSKLLGELKIERYKGSQIIYNIKEFIIENDVILFKENIYKRF